MVLGKIPSLGKDWGSLTIGESWSETRKVTKRDLFMYLGVSDDANPLYVEENYASQTAYTHTIVPAGLLFSWISALVSTHIPGPGSVMKEVRLSFPNGLTVETPFQLYMKVIRKSEKDQSITLQVNVIGEERLIVEGELDVIPPQPLRSIFQDTYENF